MRECEAMERICRRIPPICQSSIQLILQMFIHVFVAYSMPARALWPDTFIRHQISILLSNKNIMFAQANDLLLINTIGSDRFYSHAVLIYGFWLGSLTVKSALAN